MYQQMRSVLVFLFVVLASLSARAGPVAAVHDCGSLDSIGNLVGNVRSFAQGEIHVATFRPKNRFHHPSISYSSLPKNQWVAGAMPSVRTPMAAASVLST